MSSASPNSSPSIRTTFLPPIALVCPKTDSGRAFVTGCSIMPSAAPAFAGNPPPCNWSLVRSNMSLSRLAQRGQCQTRQPGARHRKQPGGSRSRPKVRGVPVVQDRAAWDAAAGGGPAPRGTAVDSRREEALAYLTNAVKAASSRMIRCPPLSPPAARATPLPRL